MKILVLTNNFDGAGTRYRYKYYEPFFIKEGIEKIDYSPFLYREYFSDKKEKKSFIVLKLFIYNLKRVIKLKREIKNYDRVIVSKEVFPYLPYFFDAYILKGTKYILDFDDYPKRYFNSFIYKKVLKNKIEKLAKNSSLVTVGNKWYFKKINTKNLFYLPTNIDFELYDKKIENDDNKVKIVWIGSPSTEHYLNIVENVLEKLSLKYDFSFRVIGGFFENNKINVELKKWSTEEEVKFLKESDIGIMPLYNTDFEKGKCGFKLIQYMAVGLPVIASKAPANEEIVVNEKNGFIVETEEEWYDCLERLIQNKELRKIIGRENRKRVKENYSYQNWAEIFIKKIKEI